MSDQAVTPTPTKGRFNATTIAIWVVVLAVLGLSAFGLLRTNTARPEAGDEAIDFTMQFFEGYDWQGQPSADLSDFRGQIVVVNFWASWCAPCRVEADLLEQTWRAYRDQGVVFLGIAYSDVEPNSKAYLAEFDITYPNAPDLGTSISDDYDITGVPETFFVDENGEVHYFHFGPIDAATLRGTLDQMLAERS
ncbi:MAG: TlpA family protein disulfide reductase [Anaerolineales bacterium]|nr:TlpA family protein disulfide reductase [Anaerolineales bacterium]